jgi:hypothetical protein
MFDEDRRRLTGEIASLGDELVLAATEGRLSALRAGLDSLRALGRSAVARDAVLEQGMEGRRRVLSMSRQLLSDDLDGLSFLTETIGTAARAAQAPDRRQALDLVIELIGDLMASAWEERDQRSFRSMGNLLLGIAQGDPSAVKPRIQHGGFEAALRCVHRAYTRIAFWRPRPIASDVHLFLSHCLDLYAELGRLAIEDSSPTHVASVVESVTDSMNYTRFRREEVQWALPVEVYCERAYLALRAWVLWLVSENRLPSPAVEVAIVSQLLGALTPWAIPSRTWDAALAEGERDTGTPWSNWEIFGRKSNEASFLSFGGYMTAVSAIELARNHEALSEMPGTPDLENLSDGDLSRVAGIASQLLSSLEHPPVEVPQDVVRSGDQLRPVLITTLQSMIKVDSDRREMELVEADLDPVRVVMFRDEFIAQLGSSEHEVIALLARCEPAESADEELMFGFALFVPKDYFVDGPVIADADDLGRQFGAEVGRGETRLVLDEIRQACETRSVDRDEIQTAIAEAAADLQSPGALTVLVAGDLSLWIDLLRSRSESRFHVDRAFDEGFEEGGLRYRFVNSSFEGVVVADFPRAACFVRGTIAADEGERFSDGTLLVDVRRVTHEVALAAAQARLEANADLDLDAEVRSLFQQVQIKVFTKPSVRVLDAAAAVVLSVAAQP